MISPEACRALSPSLGAGNVSPYYVPMNVSSLTQTHTPPLKVSDQQCADPACPRPATTTGPITKRSLCRTHYKREWRTLPPAPTSQRHLETLPPIADVACWVCGKAATHWEFDPYTGSGHSIALKQGVMFDTAPFVEKFSPADYQGCCDRKACREEFLLEPVEQMQAQILWLETLVSRVRDGTLMPKMLP